MNEKAIQTHVMDRWRKMGRAGTLLAAIPNAYAHGQPGLTRGIFDLIAIGPQIGVAFLELKTETGKLSPHQQAFMDTCHSNNVRAAVAYGLDEAINTLEIWGIIRRVA
jgi:hypothetical protein